MVESDLEGCQQRLLTLQKEYERIASSVETIDAFIDEAGLKEQALEELRMQRHAATIRAYDLVEEVEDLGETGRVLHDSLFQLLEKNRRLDLILYVKLKELLVHNARGQREG